MSNIGDRPPGPGMVPLPLITWRLLLALAVQGRLGADVQALFTDANALALAKNLKIGIYSDNPAARRMFSAMGIDPDEILSPPTWRDL